MPPWLCTSPFGMPVVPDENSTHSGCSKGTGSELRLLWFADDLIERDRRRVIREQRPDRYGRGQRWPGRPEIGHGPAPVVRPPAEPVSVNGDEYLRLELPEAIGDALGPEVRSADAPDRAEAGGREHRDDRLGDVRQVPDDPVPGLDPDARERGGERAHLTA